LENTMSTVAQTTPATAIDPATGVGLLALTVSDLERSLVYYTEAIGLAVLRRDGDTATLGVANRPLLVLTEQPGAAEWPRGGRSYTGLYHFAILMPTRADLGRWIRHWLELGLPLPGQGDHIVSEALYLEDPDGHGIEVYRDRPREGWQWQNGQVRMGTGPVDIRGLLEEAARAGEPWTGQPSGTILGHMHLQVGNIPEAVTFYHEILGFDIVAQMPSALFVSAGGYHHHIGMNTWHSLGAVPAPADSVRLRYFTVDLPTDEARRAVLARLDAANIPHTEANGVVTLQDPWQNTILLQVGPASVDQAATYAQG
jgi:catechol 2,3-dioxygenase